MRINDHTEKSFSFLFPETPAEYLSMNVTVTAWESTLQNASDSVDLSRVSYMALLISNLLKFIITLVGLAGNAVVLWLLGFCMKRNAFSVYILNLAVADFGCLSTHVVSSIMSFVRAFKVDFSKLFPVFLITFVFPYVVGLSILTAISTERCLSVLKPIWYRCHRPKHMSSVICALIWVLSLLLIILRMEFRGLLFREHDSSLGKLIDFIIATWLIFSFGLLFGSNLVLLTRLLCGSRKLKLTRLYVTIGLTVLVFLLCGLPWGIYNFLLCWMSIISTTKLLIPTTVLACVNSCANPIIYFFVGSYRHHQRQQKRSFKLILQRALQDVPEEDGNQGSPPQENIEMSGNSHVT
ncbi:mas-related G-protein coupled receptor member X1-like [Sorex fumeus]|uniref:mas-related G-protein coupled receptor member X1-like n=1 Tax=Sorex fumeus TaxID=62283 RepID=UPI0024AE1FA3|nr:mas-related G-protein coupled receptor member X1-like [Sorex fumeus]